jgi:hypothetical protein
MDRLLPSDAPILHKALLRAATYVLISLVGFAALTLIAYYVPGNYLLRRDSSSPLESKMPEPQYLPAGLMLTESYSFTPSEVAADYPDMQEARQNFAAWGRENSYSQYYIATERCTHSGIRSLRLTLIPFKDVRGAQQFYAYILKLDGEQSKSPQTMNFADEAYQLQNAITGRCAAEEEETLREMVFRRGSYVATITLTAAAGYASPAYWQEQMLRIARVFEQMLR